MKKKDPEPELAESQTEVPQASTTASNKDSVVAIDPVSNDQTATSWDDSEEQKQAEEKLAFAERVKAASEKEAARALKTLEYEKRMSSSYPEFRWDDPLRLVSL